MFDLGAVLSQSPVSESDTIEIQRIDIDLIDDDPRNFYELSDLDDLAANIELLGLQQPLRVRDDPEQAGRYIIVSGHRRRAAIRKLVEEGREDLREIPCIKEQDAGSPAMQELRLIYANSDTRKLSPADISRQAERVEALLYQLKEEGVSFPGRMRDHVAQACKVSKSKLARLKVIREGLIPDYKERFDKGEIPESSAYTLARFPTEFQLRLVKAMPKLPTDYGLKGLLEEYEKGERWTPCLTCPDNSTCHHGDAFLRHDAENGPYSKCLGKKCCLTCPEATRNYDPCPRACAKAKAMKKDNLDEKRAKEEAKRKKQQDEFKAQIQKSAVRLLRAVDAAGLPDNETINPGYSYEHYKVKEIRDYAAGEFGSKYFYNNPLAPQSLQHVGELAELLNCSADYLLGIKDELEVHSGQPTGQMVFNGYMPGGTTPSKPCDVVAVFDFGAGEKYKQILHWDGANFLMGRESKTIVETPVYKWMALPPDEDEEG